MYGLRIKFLLILDFFDNAHTEGIKGDSEQSEIRTKKDSTSDEKYVLLFVVTMSLFD